MSKLKVALQKATSSNYQWLIPKKYPLETKEQALSLLEEGYVLINNHGYSVFLHKGNQVKSNCNRERDYKFSKPYLWQVLDLVKTTNDKTVICNYNSISFRVERLFRKLGTKWL